MKQAADELYNMNKGTTESVANAGVSLDCSWNSRAWQAKEGVVAAISQDTGKIIDIVHKIKLFTVVNVPINNFNVMNTKFLLWSTWIGLLSMSQNAI